MRILVTGGAGFIGSHVVDSLFGDGHELVVVDNLTRGKRENLPAGVELAQLDVRSAEVERLVDELRPEVLLHFAAQMDVRHSVADPVYDADVNVLGTARLLAAAARAGTPLAILASTGGAIYGEQEHFPADESHPTRPESPYGLSKLCAELYAGYFARVSPLRAIALRFGNVYGPRQDPHGEAGVVAIFAGQMLRGETPTIYGDGTQTRDYVYVGDVVEAFRLAMAHPSARGAFNIGTGVETDVNTLARHIGEAAGFSGELRHAEARVGEQRRSVLDTNRAQKVLGWTPKVSLAAGIPETVGWFRDQG